MKNFFSGSSCMLFNPGAILFFTFFLLLFPATGNAQTIYTSHITQTWPGIFNTAYEEVERTISLEENSIGVGTQTSSGKEFETYYIQRIDHNDPIITYHCLSGDNEKVKFVFPYEGDARFIDLFRKSRKTGEEYQERYHIFDIQY